MGAVMSDWRLTVGMEVHVELQTKTKMFCGCKNDPFGSKPNTNVCPVCFGLPGALPVMNRKAVEMTIKLGQALRGKIASRTFWARKNYFYPDLPKGYQISQSTSPLVEAAVVTIDGKDHRIHRIHLEEDAGKSTHSPDKSHSLVNYNRAGVPLMEIVTEPDFDSAESAKRFCQELQRIMRHLDISSADMEKGLMRCEANISVSKDGGTSGTKVEVKNINSFRAVEKAINYEYDRQTKALEAGEKLVQETRTWDEANQKTVSMRTKETSADYRYFPEPDLPVVVIGELGEASHKLPEDQRRELLKIGLPEDMARIIVDRGATQKILDVAENGNDLGLEAAKLLLALPEFGELTFKSMVQLTSAKRDNGWANPFVQELIQNTDRSEAQIERAIGEKATSSHDIEAVAKEVISENPKIVKDFQNGNPNALNALVGQMMKKTQGAVNVAQARAELEKQLS